MLDTIIVFVVTVFVRDGINKITVVFVCLCDYMPVFTFDCAKKKIMKYFLRYC